MITQWSPKKHYRAIASWYHARGLEAPSLAQLPQVGFIVDGIVAGWVYQTDSSVALLDAVISNPATIPSRRKQATKVLCSTLVDAAVEMGYRDVLFTSSHPTIKRAGEELGFRRLNQEVFLLNEPE